MSSLVTMKNDTQLKNKAVLPIGRRQCECGILSATYNSQNKVSPYSRMGLHKQRPAAEAGILWHQSCLLSQMRLAQNDRSECEVMRTEPSSSAYITKKAEFCITIHLRSGSQGTPFISVGRETAAANVFGTIHRCVRESPAHHWWLLSGPNVVLRWQVVPSKLALGRYYGTPCYYPSMSLG